MVLTHESDRPYSRASIARRVHQVTGDRYLAGLWLEDLARGLLWVGIAHPIIRNTLRIPGIPSWSWMSLTNPVTKSPSAHFCISNLQKDSRLSICRGRTFALTKADDNFGAVLDGQIHLVAPMRGAVVHEDVHGHLFFHNKDEHVPVYMDCPQDKTEPVSGGDVLYCLLIGTRDPLLARRVN